MASNSPITFADLTKYNTKMLAHIDSKNTKALKYLAVKDKKICFYADPAPTEESIPDFEVNIPVEYFLDQTKTVLVQSFTWSEESYPGSINPNYDERPVLVLALKGDDNTVT